MKITITLSDKQANVLVGALDLYSRILIGQLENVEEVLRFSYHDLSLDKLTQVKGLFDAAKSLLFGFGGGASYGIHNHKVPDAARQAFDLLQGIRNTVARAKKPEGGFQVCYDTPRQTSLEEKLPEVVVEL